MRALPAVKPVRRSVLVHRPSGESCDALLANKQGRNGAQEFANGIC